MPANVAIVRDIAPAWASLIEQVQGSSFPVIIDREQGIIRNVKVLGTRSPNTPFQNGRPMPGVTEGTAYSPNALRAAVKVMEGAKVRLNHPDRRNPNQERIVEEGLGILKNVRASADGLRADLHYNRFHPFAPQLIEDVERRMGQWGFSPNATGVGQVKNGIYVVEEIAHCRSVDLVSDPATTVNLWESRHYPEATPMSCTFRDFCGSVLPLLKGKRRIAMVNFLESDYMADPKDKVPADMVEEDPVPPEPNLGDTPVEPMAEGSADPMEAITSGFNTALKALVDAATSGEMTEEEAISKFRELVKTHAKLKSGGGGNDAMPAAVAEEMDEDAKEEEAEGEMKESKDFAAIQARLKRFEAKEKIVALCESLNFKPTATQIDGLVEMQESRWRPFILDTIKQQRKPISGSPHLVADAAEKAKAAAKAAKPATDDKSFLDAITR